MTRVHCDISWWFSIITYVLLSSLNYMLCNVVLLLFAVENYLKGSILWWSITWSHHFTITFFLAFHQFSSFFLYFLVLPKNWIKYDFFQFHFSFRWIIIVILLILHRHYGNIVPQALIPHCIIFHDIYAQSSTKSIDVLDEFHCHIYYSYKKICLRSYERKVGEKQYKKMF